MGRLVILVLKNKGGGGGGVSKCAGFRGPFGFWGVIFSRGVWISNKEKPSSGLGILPIFKLIGGKTFLGVSILYRNLNSNSCFLELGLILNFYRQILVELKSGQINIGLGIIGPKLNKLGRGCPAGSGWGPRPSLKFGHGS